MRTNKLLYLVAVICFTLLFYRQDAGINIFLFAVLLLTASGIMNRSVRKTKEWLIIAAGTIISSFFIIWYANGLTNIMTVISLLILAVLQRSRYTSYIPALAGSVLSVFGTFIFIIYGKIRSNRINHLRRPQVITHVRKWPVIIVVAIIVFLFLSLYRSSSPIFNFYFSKLINLEWVDWDWILITLIGSVLLYSFFFKPPFFKKLLKIEKNYGKTITEESLKPHSQSLFSIFSNLETERYSAILLFAILNLLLLFLNLGDIHYLFLKGELPAGVTYSDYVHSGVEAVIMSIVMAILLIAYYFRGHLNFGSESRLIRGLTYLWVVQNMGLIAMAAFKNQLYIDAYSLTLLRIGVYYFLAFSVIGLILTFYKLYFKKDTWFLFRSNSFVIYTVLVLSCSINWNSVVTQANIKNSYPVDYEYLNSLGYENYRMLWENKYYDSIANKTFLLHLTGKPENYNLPQEIGYFLTEYENTDIVSYCINREKAYRYFAELAKSNKLPKP